MGQRGAVQGAELPRAVPPGLRHNRNFRLLWLGQAVSLLGDQVLETTVLLWVAVVIAAGRPWGPLAVSGTLVAGSLPVVLFGLVGGVYADRWDRRRTMLAMDAIRAVLLGGLAAFAVAGRQLPATAQLAVVYATVALTTVAAQFFGPARFGLLGVAIADEDRERASSLSQGTGSIAAILGPPIAAPLLVIAGPAWALVSTAAGFVVSFAAVYRVRVPATLPDPATGRHHPRRELTTGLRYFLGHRQLRIILVTLVVVASGAGTLGALNAFFVIGNLHTSARFFGVLSTALGVGSVAGAAVSATVARRLGATRVYVLGLVLTGLGVIGYARMTSLVPALVILFLLGIPLAAANGMIGPLILRATPPDLLGRVIAVLQPVTQVAVLASVALATWLAGAVLHGIDATLAGVHFGAIDTILLAGGLLIAAGGVAAALTLPSSPAAQR